MSRNLLHINKLGPFKEWLDGQGIHYREGNGAWQILQVHVGTHWHGIYERADMPEHYTTDHRIDPLVKRFIRESKGKR